MATLTKIPLSASSSGVGILITGTTISTTANVIHACTTSTGAGAGDELVIWAINAVTGDRKLTIGWGGTASGQDRIILTVTGTSFTNIIPGLLLKGGADVFASATQAGAVSLLGYCLRAV